MPQKQCQVLSGKLSLLVVDHLDNHQEMFFEEFYLGAVLGVKHIFQEKVVQMGIGSYFAYFLYIV